MIRIIIIRVMIRMMIVMSIYLMTEQEGIIATTGMLKPVVLQDDNVCMGHMVMIMISITMAITMMTTMTMMTMTTTRQVHNERAQVGSITE